MDLDRHDFQLDELVTRIKSNDHRLIALQVPEGLKMQALEMMDQIEDDSDAKVVLAADPCYGACDLVHDKMRAMGVELVAHMGHSQMNIDSGMPTQFISVTYDGEPEIEGVLPILRAHLSIAESRKGAERKNNLDEEEAQEAGKYDGKSEEELRAIAKERGLETPVRGRDKLLEVMRKTDDAKEQLEEDEA